MIHVTIRERDAAAKATEPITSGSVGLPVLFRFSEDWLELGKTAVFSGSGQTLDMAITEDRCVVPHEVLRHSGGRLKIGVYGTGDGGKKVTPTVWANAGVILPGTEPTGVEESPATQTLVQQLLEEAQAAHTAAEAAETLAKSVREDADAGSFDGAVGPKGDKGDKGEKGDAFTYADFTPAQLEALTGPQGATGPQGPKGDMGDKGDKGDTGATGPQGPKGDPGDDSTVIYYRAAVAQDGTLTMPEDMPTPDELKAAVAGNESLPMIRLTDRRWLNGDGSDSSTQLLIYELRYAQRNMIQPGLAVFNTVVPVLSTGELAYVEIVGQVDDRYGTVFWSIGKETLASGADSNVFWATYNTTTFSEIKDAYDGGRLVALKGYGDHILALTYITSSVAQFSSVRLDATIFVRVTSTDVWTGEGTNLVLWDEYYEAVGDASTLTTTASDLTGAVNELNAAKYAKPSGGIPKGDLASAVQTSLNKADTALQSSQGTANAGKFLVVGSDGNITAVTMTAWQGGNY